MIEVTQREQVLACLKAELPGILASYPVMLAYLYGSVAEGYAMPASDVDIALVFDPSCRLDAYERMQIELDVADRIETGCGFAEADVRGINDAPLKAQGAVLTKGVLVYSRNEELRVEYEVRTRKLYFDFQPVLRMMQDAYFEHLEADLRRKGLFIDG
jgi:hypothetical protein